MARVTELIFRADNRSTIRALNEIADKSERTGRQVSRDTSNASRGFDTMGRSAHRLRDSMMGLGGAVGFTGLAFGIGAVVKAGEGWQVQQANLQRAFRGTGANINALTDAASRLATHGGFGTQENLQALAIFGTATRSQSKSIRDMTLATDIARRTGRNYTMIVKALALAEQGRTTGLSRLGIAIPKVTTAEMALKNARFQNTEQLRKMEAAGVKLTTAEKARLALSQQITPAMEAQAKAQDALLSQTGIFAALQARFGGQTAAYSRTTQGRVSNLQNRFKELEERLGSGLLPIVNKVLTALNNVVTWLDKNQWALKGLLGFIGAVSAAMLFNKIQTTLATTKTILFGNEIQTAGARAAGSLAGLAKAALIVAGVFLALKEGPKLVRDIKRHNPSQAAKHGALFGAGTGAVTAGLLGGSELGGEIGILGGPLGIAAGAGLGAAVGAGAGFLTSALPFHFARGGLVPQRFASGGGPAGTDTVPAWLSPGEGVLSRQGMQALAMMNHGGMGSGQPYLPVHLTIKLDSKVIAKGVTEAVLRRAARGPSSLVGGSLLAGPATAA